MIYFIKSILVVAALSLSFGFINYKLKIAQYKSNSEISKLKLNGYNTVGIPKFSILKAEDSVRIFSNEYFQNSPIAFLVFDPYCPHCKEQMKEIITNESIFKGVKFCFVTMYPFYQMKNTYKELHLQEYGNITVGTDENNFLTNYYSISAVPYMIIYNKEGLLTGMFTGKVSPDKILSLLNE